MDLARVLACGDRFWSKVQVGDNCWLWTSALSPDGYGIFQVATKQKHGAHRISWAISNGRWPSRMVLHRCGNAACVRPDHLYEGTATQNAEDARGHGTLAQGERHGNAKLTDQQLGQIRQRYVAGETQTALGAVFGVSQAQISNVVRGLQRGGVAVQQTTNTARYRLHCEQCGTEYYRKPGARPTRFCSRACGGKSQREGKPQTCPACGQEFYRPPSANAVTCSYECGKRLRTTAGEG